VYVQETNGRKAERLHIRIAPELKKRFETHVKMVNHYLKEGEEQDMSAWTNRLITYFIACCDDFSARLKNNEIDLKEFREEFFSLLTIDQFMVLYWDFYRSSIRNHLAQELDKIIDSDEVTDIKFNKFRQIVARLKEERL